MWLTGRNLGIDVHKELLVACIMGTGIKKGDTDL